MQLADYLHGRALQEWNLLLSDDRQCFSNAVQALHSRLNTGSQVHKIFGIFMQQES